VKEILMPSPNTVTSTLMDGTSEEIIRLAVTSRQPDRDVHQEDLAWWLALQERLEIRTELADHRLL
jgi:hypothetical protein